MQIIIPMTGYGSRFVNAGYKDLKPFIKIYDKPIIQWIVEKMYPGETNYTFVCRGEHLDNISIDSTLSDSTLCIEDYLNKICPTGKIFRIDDWVKKGPVFDVLRASEVIDDDEPAIINYCDFYMTWNWPEFKQKVTERNCEGCVPCYSGFHPNLLPKKNLYASCLTDEEDNLIEIREKYSFEEDKTKAKHSPGVYYFRSGSLLKKYCQKLVDMKDELNGEYYASLPYNYMVKDGLKVWIPVNVDFFCQWGTPEDMEEFLYWNDIMKGLEE